MFHNGLIDDVFFFFQDLSKDFKFMLFDEHKKQFEIHLVNEKGRKCRLRLSTNISSGAFYITRGWSNFCAANGLIRGDFCYFKLSESGERPVLLLCSHESGNGHEDKEEEECPEADTLKICSVGGCSNEKNTPSRFLTRKFTPSRFKTGQLVSSRTLFESNFSCMNVCDFDFVEFKTLLILKLVSVYFNAFIGCLA